ncbi:CMRF35-like molecule 8 isoform X3 [Leptonychotes weddellii]|uniref:CMRF35-like molecule 8 isoform X3 n=1 Tax=Leptonychotes weddellii TaxID=9713 RepID=A0A7F8RKD9_LEPWE|nr:CMRF35-like molecule 8 isoform X3 [Leptonychotes weddellii]
MTGQGWVVWLPWALLLLWGPGCSSLSGPTSVTGTVGGFLSVQCQYEEEFRETPKYWCKSPCVWSTVKTKEADREVRSGRVSIRDHPANLTFTVTLESLTVDDAGTYRCGIDISGLPGFVFDHTFRVVVSVTPAKTSAPPVSITVTQMSKSTAKIMIMPTQPSSAAPTTVGATRSASSQEEFPPSQGLGLQVLFSLLALLLLLLGGSSLLAWRMVRRRIKSGENPEPLRTPSQLCVEGRSSVLCGSRKRRDPRRMVPANTFINHSSMEVSGSLQHGDYQRRDRKNTKALKMESPLSHGQGC